VLKIRPGESLIGKDLVQVNSRAELHAGSKSEVRIFLCCLVVALSDVEPTVVWSLIYLIGSIGGLVAFAVLEYQVMICD